MRVDALFRGNFVTLDPLRPVAYLLAVASGRIVVVDEDAEGLESAVREDFGTAVAFPGFNDAHAHTAAYGIGLGQLDLSTPPVADMEALYEAVAGRAATAPIGEWVIGNGYDQNKLGGAHPTREGLDQVAGGRPVWLRHTSGHMCVVNSAVLAMIGQAVHEPVPGGRVRLDAVGQPTGLLEEQAQALVQRLFPPLSLGDLAAAIGRAHDVYVSEGLTSCCEAGVAGGWVGQSPLELAAYQLARDEGRLKVRTTAMIAADVLHDVGAEPSDGLAAALDAGIRTGLGDEWLRIGPLKVFSDGSLIGRTCWMHAGFSDDASNLGYPQADPELLRQTILAGHRGGWQVATHAIGDAAVDFVLDCYEEALQASPRHDHRHRIEHCGIASDATVGRIARLGVVPVPQGRFIGEIGDGMLAALGAERVRCAYRMRSFLDAGVSLPGSSDRPVVDGRPLLGIRDMVLRRTQSGVPFALEEALGVEEAISCYTRGSAFASRCEHERGILRPGMLADLVVLEADPRRIEPAALADLEVRATVIGGEIAYARSGL